MKPTIWIFSLEPIQTRYTAQWHEYIPKLLENKLGDKFNVVQIDGIQKDSQLTPGAFLNFSDTNYWKSSQLCNFLEHHNRGETSTNDHIIFTDAWNPTVIQLKYMKDLLGFNWIIHGMFHAGSYDPQDFLGRIIGNSPWVRHCEQAFYHAIDYNYFATDFHIDLFTTNLLKLRPDWKQWSTAESFKLYRTGWPMEYMESTLDPYKTNSKKNQIIFPHRLAPEKQVEIFYDLAASMPEYSWVVCQDQELTKEQYHTLLSQSKIVFSANLQETLGISCYEGMILGVMPLVPDRLSYCEMYSPELKYPSEWTIDWPSYLEHKSKLVERIRDSMTNFHYRWNHVYNNKVRISREYFSAQNMLKNFE